ncbi:MAG: mechanosensitive ion channel family protein [Coprobacillus sp.]
MDKFLENIINKYSQLGLDIIDALIIFVIGWYAIKLALKFVDKVMRRSNVDSIIITFIKSVVNIGLKIILFITILTTFGVNPASLLTVFAAAGAALALGLQDSMKGIVSGMTILFAKPFVKGDIIEVKSYIGRIDEIQLLYTRLMTFDNKVVIIPNNELASSTFVNYSHEDMRRVDMTMNIHYNDDVELAKEIIMQTIENHPKAFKEPLPYVRVSAYKEHSVEIGIRVWSKTDEYYELKDDLMEQIKHALDKAGVTFPYEQLDVHIYSKNES